jgi:hypothetical protein
MVRVPREDLFRIVRGQVARISREQQS